jgi:hypothetical protein
MSTQLIPEDAQALNAYDDKSFIKAKHSHRLWPNDPTCVVVFPTTQDRGTQFEPFNVPKREFHIATLPPTPLELFQLFLPFSLIEKWVHYTKTWISWLKADGSNITSPNLGRNLCLRDLPVYGNTDLYGNTYRKDVEDLLEFSSARFTKRRTLIYQELTG